MTPRPYRFPSLKDRMVFGLCILVVVLIYAGCTGNTLEPKTRAREHKHSRAFVNP